MRYLSYVYPILTFIAIIFIYVAITVNPFFIVAPAIIIIFITLMKRFERKYLEKKLLDDLDKKWGTKEFIEDEKIDIHGWSKYYSSSIDDITSNDLSLKLLFKRMNNTITIPGVHLLFKTLHEPIMHQSEWSNRRELIDKVQKNKNYRNRIQKRLIDLGKTHGEGVGKLLHEEIPTPLVGQTRYILQVLALPASIIIGIFQPMIGLLLGMLTLVYNASTYYRLKKEISVYSNAFIYIRGLIITSKQLIEDEIITDKETIEAYEDAKKFLNGLVFATGNVMSPEIAIIYDYLNIIFLIDPIRFNRTLRKFQCDLTCLKVLYEAIGELDAILSMASYEKSLDIVCQPDFSTDSKSIKMKDGINPLVENCIPNSITLSSEGALITGSNMSGKSTFLRTVGVNSLMAQTCTFAPSRELCIPRCHLVTSISIQDNIEIGDSYYLSEAKAIKRMIDSIDEKDSSLLLIDEIFNGTNRRERVAAAEAILKHFSKKPCIPFVATHDLEITDKIDLGYQKYFFKETVVDDDIHFDYHLNEGVTNTHNALEILRLIGYPDDIYHASKTYAEEN